MVCLPQIVAAHSCGLIVAEFQHGVTMGLTILYSGHYDKVADPDYFLAFGEAWKGPQFAIPVEKIINIGWAFKDMFENTSSSVLPKLNTCLVISSPDITAKLLGAILSLAAKYPHVNFHIRCHPQESYKNEERAKIESVPNIMIVDNTIDSSSAIKNYTYVIGENSSVLFEALSMEKLVGRLVLNGLNPISTRVQNDGFYYIRSESDFETFLSMTKNDNSIAGNFYSKFNPTIIDSLF